MIKCIEVEPGKKVDFKASAFTPIQYNKLFPSRDYLKDINDLKVLSEARKRQKEDGSEGDMSGVTLQMEDYEQSVRVAYCFAYQVVTDAAAVGRSEGIQGKIPGSVGLDRHLRDIFYL